MLVDRFHFIFKSFGFLSIKPSAVAGSPLCGALDIFSGKYVGELGGHWAASLELDAAPREVESWDVSWKPPGPSVPGP